MIDKRHLASVSLTVTDEVLGKINRLADYLKQQHGLTARPERRISVKNEAINISIIPVVNLAADQSHASFHRHEGGISIWGDGKVAACVVTLDGRTSIRTAQLFHTEGDNVITGPSLTPQQVANEVKARLKGASSEVSREAFAGPYGLSEFALRSLSTDSEARAAHPGLDYRELFGVANLEFLDNLRTYHRFVGAGAVYCCCTCTTGCTSSSCAQPSGSQLFQASRWYLSGVSEQNLQLVNWFLGRREKVAERTH